MSRRLGLIEKVADRRGRYHLVVYDDALVFVRREPDFIPIEPVSAAIFVISILRKLSRKRAGLGTELGSALRPEVLVKTKPGSKLIWLNEVAAAELLPFRRRRRRLRLSLKNGKTRKFVLADRRNAAADSSLLNRSLAGRLADRTAHPFG